MPQSGIGTYMAPHNNRIRLLTSLALLDMGFAINLGKHVKSAYKYLMYNCEYWSRSQTKLVKQRASDQDGDKICLIGYSRGGYIARALAGMLHKVSREIDDSVSSANLNSLKVGLLPCGNDQQIPFAYKMYTRTDATGMSTVLWVLRTY
jgi:uncharacterized protein (DUF2235 family)